MQTEVMFSSKTDQWATPTDFFEELNKEFHFNLDPCADILTTNATSTSQLVLMGFLRIGGVQSLL